LGLFGGGLAAVHVTGHDAARISSPFRRRAYARELWQA
jgi:hypothetical protein